MNHFGRPGIFKVFLIFIFHISLGYSNLMLTSNISKKDIENEITIGFVPIGTRMKK